MARPKGSKNKPKETMASPAVVPAPTGQKKADMDIVLAKEAEKTPVDQGELIKREVEATKKIVDALIKTPDERFLEQLIKDTGNEQTARAIFSVLKATSSTIGTNVKSLLSMDNETIRKLMLEAYKKNSSRSCLDCKHKNFCTIFTEQLREVKSSDPLHPGRHAFASYDIATICNLFVKDNIAPLQMSGHTTY